MRRRDSCGVCLRAFRRWSGRYEEHGIDGLRDKRLSGASHRAVPVDDVMPVVDRYRRGTRAGT